MKIGIIGSTGISIELLAEHYQFETIPVGEKQFKYYHLNFPTSKYRPKP